MVEFAGFLSDISHLLPHQIEPLGGVDIEWDDERGEDGVLGYYKPFRDPDTVVLAEMLKGQGKTAVPTLCHELRHVRQRNSLGPILFALASLPVIRGLTIERSAWEVEKAAEQALGMEGLNSDHIPFF
jgi:hypothetical protein